MTRNIDYWLYYLEAGMSLPIHTNTGVISEHLTGSIPGSGANSPSSGPPGTFPDQQSVLNFRGQTYQHVTQSFSAHLDSGTTVQLGIAAFGGRIASPIGQLDIQKYYGYISINGNIGGEVGANGRLIPGTYKECP